MKTKFFPTITAINNDHYKKLKEAEELGLEEICVFFSPLNPKKRKEFYPVLEKSKIKKIPFAHIRGDFDKNEIYYLKEKFGTTLFNFHSSNQHPILYKYDELEKEIYIENTMTRFTDEEISNYAGICLDVSHLENDRLTDRERYEYFIVLLDKLNCGCGHLSAIKKNKKYCPVAEANRYDKHFFDEFTDFDYILKYKDKLPPVIALEVENSINEQIEAIEYIKKLLEY